MHILLLSAGKILKTPFGGEDIFTRHLGDWLANKQHEVTLMGIEFAGIKVRHLTYNSVKKERVTMARTKKNEIKKFGLGYLFYSLRTVFWLFQVLKIVLINMTDPIHIIHAQDSGYTGLAAIIAGKILNIPVIVSLLGIRYEQIKSNPYINETLKRLALKLEYKLDVFALTNADVITIVNTTMKNYVQKAAPKSVIRTIPVAINTNNFKFSESKRDSLRRELKINQKSTVIGYIGRLSYEKNLNTLLNSFAAAVTNDASLRLVLVGKGPMEFALKMQAQNMHVEDKVIFCGFRHDISNILSGFDIFVLPSFMEGTSNALLEAMACNRAIICSDIPANRELVTNYKDALLIKPDDPGGFKDAILLLSADKKLRTRLGNNAKINAQTYDQEMIFPVFVQCYQDSWEKSGVK